MSDPDALPDRAVQTVVTVMMIAAALMAALITGGWSPGPETVPDRGTAPGLVEADR
jgi:hypothetical protein